MSVVMLEEGRHFTTDDFTARPREMSTILYRDAGQVVTVGNTPIILPLGKGVGGTTMINSGTCFRTPEPVLEMWGERFGLDELTRRARSLLPPRRARAERRAGAGGPRGPQRARRRSAVRTRSAGAATSSGATRAAASAPASAASAARRRAKQHVGLSYVPRAWAAGATTYTECRARADRARRPPRARGDRARPPAADGARRVLARRRRVRRDPHAAVLLAAAGPRRAFGRARPQPRDPPRDGGARAVRRGDRHGERRAAVVLHRRVRRRGDHARGRRGPARLRRDVVPVRGREAPRADAPVPEHRAVRADGLRPLARATCASAPAASRSATT